MSTVRGSQNGNGGCLVTKEIDWSAYAPLFTEDEFACKCGCGIANVDPSFLTMLYEARQFARWLVNNKHDIGRQDIPFVISSGCRCPTHNARETGARQSAHITTPDKPGYAADIVAATGAQRFVIVEALILAGFRRIQPVPAKNIIHCDADPHKVVPWMG